MPNKTIHYCWFGGNPLPETVVKCMKTWAHFCPDYEIIRWDETNFDVGCCDYVREAYEAKKWAFVSDYCRFYVLYHYGGIYLDTDVELLKSLDGLPDTFIGFENWSSCASGLIRGAQPGDKVCAMMLESYRKDHFALGNGRYNTKTVCQRETGILVEQGLLLNGRQQFVANTHVYPVEYFCPKNYYTQEQNITDNTYSIHHYDASWYTEEDRFAVQLRDKYRKILPAKLAIKAAKIEAIIKMRGAIAALTDVAAYVFCRK